MELVAFLGSDKESWGQVSGLIMHGQWEKILLVKTAEAKLFPIPKHGEAIIVDSSQSLIDLKKDLMEKLRGKLSGLDVSVSIASGNGKEHMALLSALLSLPAGIRFTVFTRNGIEFIS